MYETVYLGRDNALDLLFVENGDVVDISNTIRITIEFDDTVIDSDTRPDAFDWSDGEDGKLYLTLGDENIPIGSYNALIVIYDSIYTDGMVWDDFRCRVVQE